ncbi:MAG TPA: SDR family NAD(P)-dependent oxidoreductase, partial [Candidatus Binataceae bacterium]|nr:SDR family NAD(P)-dependent oxidoreductase [Candidatus Binataceae bacterium]
MNQLEGKITLITGAKGGLGSFVTEAFLAAGAKVVGVSRSIQANDFKHPEFAAIPAELSSGDAAHKLATAVVERFGRIDALVHVMG